MAKWETEINKVSEFSRGLKWNRQEQKLIEGVECEKA